MKKTDETITTEEQESAPSEQDQQENPTIMRVIETPMEDEERIEVGVELTDLLTIIEELETERKAKNASYNDNIKVKQGNAHKLSNKFRAAVHTAERECPIEYQWDNGTKLVKHPDTGETLLEDVISEDERQEHLGLDGKADEGEEEMPHDERIHADLMPCASDKCDDVLEGKCTRPDGSIECHGYEAPEADDSEEHETLTEGEPGQNASAA